MIPWERFIELVQVVAVPVGGWVVRQLALILTQLKYLNGRVAKMEGWQIGHEQLDKERFDSLQREMDHQGDRCVEHIRAAGKKGHLE